MNKRTDRIRSLFATPADEVLAAANNAPAPQRVASGAVRNLKDTFSDVERENEELRARIGSGDVPVELDPSLIDPSPLSDRFEHQDSSKYEALKESIAQRGQFNPILVREHPVAAGRYQHVFGRRRVAAALDLGIKVKAFVRPMSDEDLAVAQGIENNVREDPSFIERACFALALEEAGFGRTVIQAALSVDRADASKLVAVARMVPGDVLSAIGRAPKIGRPRWQTLSNRLSDPAAIRRVRSVIGAADFDTRATDERFVLVLAAANKANRTVLSDRTPRTISSSAGTQIALLSKAGKGPTLSFKTPEKDFADFLADRLPDLYEEFTNEKSPSDD